MFMCCVSPPRWGLVKNTLHSDAAHKILQRSDFRMCQKGQRQHDKKENHGFRGKERNRAASRASSRDPISRWGKHSALRSQWKSCRALDYPPLLDRRCCWVKASTMFWAFLPRRGGARTVLMCVMRVARCLALCTAFRPKGGKQWCIYGQRLLCDLTAARWRVVCGMSSCSEQALEECIGLEPPRLPTLLTHGARSLHILSLFCRMRHPSLTAAAHRTLRRQVGRVTPVLPAPRLACPGGVASTPCISMNRGSVLSRSR
jgi:hypothetical protein